MKSIDISKIFANVKNSSSPCCNPKWGESGLTPPVPTTTTTTTTSIVELGECVVILNYGEQLYAYNPNNNEYIFIGNFTPGGGDIANTTSKLWFYNGTLFYEYNMQLSPFYAAFNRTINATLPISNLYVGLHALDNSHLITSDTNSSPNRIVTLNISSNTAVEVNSFDLPPGKFISGDIVLTNQNKIILTTDGGGNSFLYQYSYPDGTLEIEVDLGSEIIYPYGLIENNDNLYLVTGPGKIVRVDLTPPYTLTEIQDTGLLITGTTQLGSCFTVSLSQ